MRKKLNILLLLAVAVQLLFVAWLHIKKPSFVVVSHAPYGIGSAKASESAAFAQTSGQFKSQSSAPMTASASQRAPSSSQGPKSQSVKMNAATGSNKTAKKTSKKTLASRLPQKKKSTKALSNQNATLQSAGSVKRVKNLKRQTIKLNAVQINHRRTSSAQVASKIGFGRSHSSNGLDSAADRSNEEFRSVESDRSKARLEAGREGALRGIASDDD
jgi:hypothetical protein